MSNLGLNMEVEPPRGSDPAKKGRGAVWLALILFLVVLLGLAGFLLKDRILGATADDYEGAGSGEVVIQVTEGQTLAEIGDTLKEAGVVASAQAFITAASTNEQSAAIGPGYYRMAERMSGEAALSTMLDPNSLLITRIPVPEGLRLNQVVKRLSNFTEIPRSRFYAALKRSENLGLVKFAEGNPEGFLFPATYEFPPQTRAPAIISAMFERYRQAADDIGFVAKSEATGYTPYEVMVIASLVQAEGHPDDYGKVSRVIYNRLAAGMPLQLDATVNYALDKSEINLSADQLATDSPYNTYIVGGLPPTPINQPGEAAMRAALKPDEGDWLYFVAVNPDTGETKFTSSYSEFLEFQQEFQEYVAKSDD